MYLKTKFVTTGPDNDGFFPYTKTLPTTTTTTTNNNNSNNKKGMTWATMCIA